MSFHLYSCRSWIIIQDLHKYKWHLFGSGKFTSKFWKWEWKIICFWVSFPTQIGKFWDTGTDLCYILLGFHFGSRCRASPINTRTGGEGGKKCPPLRFFADGGKTAAFFQYLFTIELDTLCKNFNPRSPKVRSPGQVKVKNGFLTLRLRSGYTRYPIGFKPSAFHKVMDIYNLYISDFLYLSPEVR